MLILKPATEAVQKPTLPVPQVTSEVSEDGKFLLVTTAFPLDYPEEAIGKRYGRAPKDEKGELTGEPKPVTSLTYGKARKISLGFADPNGNLMQFDAKVYAQTAEAEEGEGEDNE